MANPEKIPEILPAFPGLDAGLHGHWGKYNQNNLAKKQLNYLFESGADIVDIGGESTKPGSKSVGSNLALCISSIIVIAKRHKSK